MDTHNHAWAYVPMLMCAHSDIKLMWNDRVTSDKYGCNLWRVCVSEAQQINKTVFIYFSKSNWGKEFWNLQFTTLYFILYESVMSVQWLVDHMTNVYRLLECRKV